MPDGVATVRISYTSGQPVTARVAENVYSFEAPHAIVARLNSELRRQDTALRSKRHLSKRERRKRAERFVRMVERLFMESEPSKIEWLAPGGAVVGVMGRPGRKQLAALLGG